MRDNGTAIQLFFCSFGWGYCSGAETPVTLPEHWHPVTCCGSIEPEQILDALAGGCSGVLILACRRGECHFQEGEWHCLKRVELLKPLLEANGIDPGRLRM